MCSLQIKTLKTKRKKKHKRNKEQMRKTSATVSVSDPSSKKGRKMKPRSSLNWAQPRDSHVRPMLNAAIATAWFSIIAKAIIASFVKLGKWVIAQSSAAVTLLLRNCGSELQIELE